MLEMCDVSCVLYAVCCVLCAVTCVLCPYPPAPPSAPHTTQDVRTGGFCMHAGGEIDSRGTYTALAVARILNMLTPQVRVCVCV